MKEIITVQMVQWLSSVSANQVSNACTGSNPTCGQFFSIFFSLPVTASASDAGKAVYIHQQPSMGDTPYVGSRLGDDYIYKPQVDLSDIYTLHISIMTL